MNVMRTWEELSDVSCTAVTPYMAEFRRGRSSSSLWVVCPSNSPCFKSSETHSAEYANSTAMLQKKPGAEGSRTYL